ncbi:MAG: CoA-binding protein, partial [Chloroflexi bacterium]|nr:CoA-binding protein [Chloroflexota bacterium]
MATLPPATSAGRADPLRPSRRPLEAIFAPRTVAVIGASEHASSVGRALFANLIDGRFKGKVFAVNAQHSAILGRESYPSVAALPEVADLAVIATPAATVPEIMQ